MDRIDFKCGTRYPDEASPQTPPRINKPRIRHSLVSSTIFSYPSQGGLIRKRNITRVELDWLGLTPTVLQAIPQKEDDLSLRMLQLGGRWWPSQELYDRHNYVDWTYGHHYPPNLDIGHTSTGGVLVLRTWAGNSPYLDDSVDLVAGKPDDWSRLSLCATMEERCDVLRDFGAVLYESVEECPYIPKSLDEGIAQGREYEVLLKKMEDRDYVDQWLCSL